MHWKNVALQFPPSRSSLHVKENTELLQASAPVQGSLSVDLETEYKETQPTF